ncbi:MAG: hypothetical protein GXC94_00840 [Comamonadaceae bacterium]|nr:hypothetical protein [Comamonadaceae bacterium]
MEEQNDEGDQKPKQVRKVIGDLDDLVKAVRTSLPPAKPWQRQLLAHLTEVDRQIQILRVTLSLRRPDEEVAEATEQLRVSLRVAQRYVATGRADLATRAAVLLACELGLKVNASLA